MQLEEAIHNTLTGGCGDGGTGNLKSGAEDEANEATTALCMVEAVEKVITTGCTVGGTGKFGGWRENEATTGTVVKLKEVLGHLPRRGGDDDDGNLEGRTEDEAVMASCMEDDIGDEVTTTGCTVDSTGVFEGLVEVKATTGTVRLEETLGNCLGEGRDVGNGNLEGNAEDEAAMASQMGEAGGKVTSAGCTVGSTREFEGWTEDDATTGTTVGLKEALGNHTRGGNDGDRECGEDDKAATRMTAQSKNNGGRGCGDGGPRELYHAAEDGTVTGAAAEMEGTLDVNAKDGCGGGGTGEDKSSARRLEHEQVIMVEVGGGGLN